MLEKCPAQLGLKKVYPPRKGGVSNGSAMGARMGLNTVSLRPRSSRPGQPSSEPYLPAAFVPGSVMGQHGEPEWDPTWPRAFVPGHLSQPNLPRTAFLGLSAPGRGQHGSQNGTQPESGLLALRPRPSRETTCLGRLSS
jgi:hypothetical protein